MNLTFIFDFLLYKQIERVAMGSPLGEHWLMLFYAITKKNGRIIVHLIANLLYTEGMLIFLFFFHLKKISSLL